MARKSRSGRSRKGGATEPSAPPVSGKEFLIAGIGSSAGGIEALEEVLRALPAEGEMALVVVQHRAVGSGEDLLPEVLRKFTSRPVLGVEDGTTVEAGPVYVSPAEMLLGVSEGRLSIVGRQRPRDMPIDFFLRSLAADVQHRAAAVLLSGANTDGTLGAKDIREQGGLVLAQAPETAGFPAMPKSVVDAGLADEILPPGRIGEALAAHARVARGIWRAAPDDFPESERDKLLILLKRATGHAFTSYKASMVSRQIARRMNLHRVERPRDYVEFVRSDAEEAQALFRDLLIGVTRFFRDPEAFEALGKLLAEEYLPSLRAESFRVWVAGCSTGEEAYSVAMLLREVTEKARVRLDVTIYATDLDARSIEVGRAGFYPENIAIDVAEERLRRFFTKEERGYRVRKEIRGTVVFARQNVLEDPPFARLDLLSCRNLLMYLRQEAQEEVLSRFAFALKPGGFLFLGSAEGVRPLDEAFEEKIRPLRIYRRTETKAPGRLLPREVEPQPRAATAAGGKHPEEPAQPLRGAAERFLLEECVPPSVLVDAFGNLRYVHGHTGAFLEPAQGRATLNVAGMARPGLEPHLASALREAVSNGKEAVRRAVPVRSNDHVRPVDLYVRPVDRPELREPCFMISFLEAGPAPAEPDSSGGPAEEDGAPDREKFRLLRNENERLRNDIQTLIQQYEKANEELQTTNEELQSANEELHSSNEELKSANEEMETGREELQAMNEEQTTLNAELERKVEELTHIQDDMEHLLAGTNVATLFLDSALAIRRFTPAMKGIMNLRASDVGRPVGHLTLRLKYARLADDAADVLATLQTLSREVGAGPGAWYQMRIMPYRTQSNVIDGVVVTFQDVSALKNAEREAKLAQALAEGIVHAIAEPLLVLDSEFRVQFANPGFYREFRVSREETEGKRLCELGSGQWDIPRLRELLEEVIPKSGEVNGFQVEHDFPQLGRRRMVVSARRVEAEGAPQRIVVLIAGVRAGAGNEERRG